VRGLDQGDWPVAISTFLCDRPLRRKSCTDSYLHGWPARPLQFRRKSHHDQSWGNGAELHDVAKLTHCGDESSCKVLLRFVSAELPVFDEFRRFAQVLPDVVT
jgi:hypothetical protein